MGLSENPRSVFFHDALLNVAFSQASYRFSAYSFQRRRTRVSNFPCELNVVFWKPGDLIAGALFVMCFVRVHFLNSMHLFTLTKGLSSGASVPGLKPCGLKVRFERLSMSVMLSRRAFSPIVSVFLTDALFRQMYGDHPW